MDIYTNLFTTLPSFSLNLGDILKIPFVIFLIANVFYSFMLVLKVKILTDTVDSENNGKVRGVVYINLAISLITMIIATILILLG